MRKTHMLKAALVVFMLVLVGLILALNADAQVAVHNLALNDGTTAVASSSYSLGFGPEGAIDGNRTGANWGNGGGWNDATRDVYPDTLTVSLARSYAVSHVVIYSLVDTFPSVHEPSDTETCNNYGLVDFTVEALDSSGATLASTSVAGNTLCKRDVAFPSVVPNVRSVRLTVDNANSHFSRVVEFEIPSR